MAGLPRVPGDGIRSFFLEGMGPDNGNRGNVDDRKETEESKEPSKTAEDHDTTKGGSEVPKTPSPEVEPPSETSSESHDTEDGSQKEKLWGVTQKVLSIEDFQGESNCLFRRMQYGRAAVV